MWKILFEKGKEQWKQMNFSKKVNKTFGQMKKINYDKNIVIFLRNCLLSNYIELSIRFTTVYGTLKDFLKDIQGKG